MVYEVVFAFYENNIPIRQQIINVASIDNVDGIYKLLDADGEILFSAPNDSVLYINRLSLG